MNLRTLLTGLVPTLSGMLGGGSYDDALRMKAAGWASDVGAAALREGRDATDALTALLALSRADDFEMQQLGLTASYGMCDALLGEVASNVAPAFAPVDPERRVSTILNEISDATRQACNAFTIDARIRRQMIAVGAELERAVAREIASGARGPDDGIAARTVHEAIAEVATCPVRRRDDEAVRVHEAVARLAA